jgi:hypothetical protein
VVNEPTQSVSNWRERNGFDSTPIAQLSYKQRRARQQLPVAGQALSTLGDMADGSPGLPDQTTV